MMGPDPALSRAGKVLVVCVGSGTGRLMRLIHQTSGSNVDTLYVTTDGSDIGRTKADTKFLIGKRLCGGKGAMGLTELGEKSAEDARRDLEPFMEGYGLVINIASLGKGTASGAAHVLASIGEGMGAFVMNILLLPSATLESMPRTIANHAKNRMVKRGFNVVSVDQDRFQEINGSQPIARTLTALDALLSWIVVSIAETIYGRSKRSVTLSDLRSVFREGNEGSLFVGGSQTSDPRTAAEEFASCGLMKRDPKTGKGYFLNMVKPMGLNERATKPFVKELLELIGAEKKTVFIGTIEDPHRTDVVDLIGIVTGMDDGSVVIPTGNSGQKKLPENMGQHPIDRWDIPMVR
ncbi:MAG: hypothetical protein U9R75_00520 [Candidatus Thermoplasmatota archaeon]|nr:hypothetical protein [Candidatus Thermoplasmatota archaeon]